MPEIDSLRSCNRPTRPPLSRVTAVWKHRGWRAAAAFCRYQIPARDPAAPTGPVSLGDHVFVPEDPPLHRESTLLCREDEAELRLRLLGQGESGAGVSGATFTPSPISLLYFCLLMSYCLCCWGLAESVRDRASICNQADG